MILQGLMLAACIAAYVFRKRTLSETKDSIYEEPEVDHIYEGLAIETCEGDLYEEISVYAHAEGAEAPWEWNWLNNIKTPLYTATICIKIFAIFYCVWLCSNLVNLSCKN